MSQKFRAPMPRSERRRYSGGGTTSAAGAVTGEMLGDGHTHQNLSVLDQLSMIDEGYLYRRETTFTEEERTDEETGEKYTETVKTETDYKLNAGLADVAKDLTEDSKVWELVLRKDKEDETNYLVAFNKGLKIGDAIISWDSENGALKVSKSMYSEGALSAMGIGNSSGGTGSGSGDYGIELLTNWNDYEASTAEDVGLSAKLGMELKEQIRNIPEYTVCREWLTIKVNGQTQIYYNGSGNQTFDLTPAALGAATEDHNHDTVYAKLGHNHDDTYAKLGHNHDGTYAKNGHTHTFDSITNKPTTLAGYGITDAAASSHNHDTVYAKLGHNHDDTYAKNGHTHSNYASKVKVNGTEYAVSSNLVTLPNYPTALKCPTALTLQFNGTTKLSYDGSATKTLNITPAAIGAAASSHSHTFASITNKPTTLEGYGITGGTLSGTLTVGGLTTLNGLKIGDAIISWDSENGALKVSKSMYSEGAVSAMGIGNSSGGSSDALTNEPLTINFNGATQLSYDGKAAKTINITPAAIGAAASSHSHDYLPLSGGTVSGNLVVSKYLGCDSLYVAKKIEINGYLVAATGVKTDTLMPDSGTLNVSGYVQSTGFKIKNLDNTSILLAGGGTKPVADFATASHNHDEYISVDAEGNAAIQGTFSALGGVNATEGEVHAQKFVIDDMGKIGTADQILLGDGSTTSLSELTKQLNTAGLAITGVLNMTKLATMTSLVATATGMKNGEMKFYLIGDSSGSLTNTSETYVTFHSAVAALFGKSSSMGASVGDVLMQAKLNGLGVYRVMPLNDAKQANGSFPGCDGLETVWDKTQINKVPGIETTANNALPRWERLPHRGATNMNDALETGIYPWCTLGRPTGATGAFTCITQKSSDKDGNGYYTIEQTAYGRSAELGQIYKRIIFQSDSSTDWGDWIKIGG